MIDIDITMHTQVSCDMCGNYASHIVYPDPFSRDCLSDVSEDSIYWFVEVDGWKIEDEDAMCPACITARENREEPLDKHRNNGGIDPKDGVGIPLFDLFAKDEL